MSDMLHAGVARRIVNPPLGVNKAGLRLFADPIQAVESDLTGTVLVLKSGDIKVAIIACDLIVIPTESAFQVRRLVAEAIGTSASHVLLNFSHNHSSPALPGWTVDPRDQAWLKAKYQEKLFQWLVEAAQEAASNLSPARIGAGWGESYIGVYRRETGPDGRDVLGEVPDHPIDPAVGVIRVDDLEGDPIAVLFSYGCHPVTVGPLSMVASTDFPGPARDVVERNLGGMAIFLQACGGNINPRIGIGYEVDCRESKNRVGWTLGGEVLRVASDIRTHVKGGERTELGDIPNILFTPWIPVDGDSSAYLGAAEEVVPLEFIELPSLDDALAIQERWHQNLADREAKGAQPWERRVAHHFSNWADKLVESVRDGHPTLDLVLQAIRIDDIVLASINVEAFFETGLAVKAKSPIEHTQVLGYSNGVVCYLPRKEDYPPEGWQVSNLYAVPDLYVQSYTLPVALQPDSEELAVDRLIALIRQLQ
jgi:hypothetical protein